MLLFCERHPEAGLAPAIDAPERAAFLQGVLYLANTLQPLFRLWFYPSDIGAADEAAFKAGLRPRIEKCFDHLAAQLADGRPYLLGERFSALRPLRDDADALVAQHAQAGDGMARAEGARRPRACAGKLAASV